MKAYGATVHGGIELSGRGDALKYGGRDSYCSSRSKRRLRRVLKRRARRAWRLESWS